MKVSILSKNILKVDYKIFYKICGFIEDKDYSNNLLKNESIYSKQELINDLNIYYKNFDLITLLSSLEKLKKSEINEVLFWLNNFIKFFRKIKKIRNKWSSFIYWFYQN